jgi:hypothetical protein
MRLGIYTRASTANPTGRRPWNSRLSYYVPNSFAVPTYGQGPFLLNPGVAGAPMQAGGVPAPMTPAIAMSGLGMLGQPPWPIAQPRRPAVWSVPVWEVTAPAYSVRRGRRAMNMGAVMSPGMYPVSPILARSARSFLNPGTAVPAQPAISSSVAPQPMATSGFTPIGTAPSGANIYTSAPGLATQAYGQGYYQVGVNAQGQPIYSTNPSASQLQAAQTYQSLYALQQQNAAAAAGAAAPAAATTTTTSTSTFDLGTWLSTDSLGFGLNNGWYLAIGGGALFLLMSKRGR